MVDVRNRYSQKRKKTYKVIWTLAKKLGLSRDDVHEMAGVSTLTVLSDKKLNDLANRLLE